MKVLYTGSFNPFHNGHLKIYEQACAVFGAKNVYLGLAQNPKKPKPDIDLKWVLHTITPNVVVIDGLVAEYARDNGFNLFVRSFRNSTDFEYETSMAKWNKRIGNVDTIFFPCTGDDILSSSVLRDLMSYGKDITQYMPFLTYTRYMQKQPIGALFTGRIASGKSTYLQSFNTGISSIFKFYDLDKVAKEKIPEQNRNMVKQAIDGMSRFFYEDAILDLIHTYDLLEDIKIDEYTYIESSALGMYMVTALKHYNETGCLACKNFLISRVRFKIIEYIVSEKVRGKRIRSRNLSTEYTDKIDFFYRTPFVSDGQRLE